MEVIPAAFEREFCKSNDLEIILDKIVVRKMYEFEEFDYPDLPIEFLGNDVNGGTDWKKHIKYKTVNSAGKMPRGAAKCT
jgi:hypothetical protein